MAPPTAVALRYEGKAQGAPGRLAVDADGNLYITQPETGRVLARGPAGGLRVVKEGLEAPLAIAVDPQGGFYVSELGAGRVSIFDAAWRRVGELGQGDGEFGLPTDVSVHPLSGTVFVADGRAHLVKVYEPTGAFSHAFGGRGGELGQLEFPAAVHVTADDEVLVGDQSNDRVQVFDLQGALLRCFGSRSTSFSRRFGRIQGLTTDHEGRIYVADAFQGNVRVFDRDGVLLSTIGSLGEAVGELRTPLGLVLDHFNRLFVASRNNGRLEIFGVDAFTDPRVLAASVQVRPRWLFQGDPRPFVQVTVGVEGVEPEAIVASSVTANGVSALPGARVIGDTDHDGFRELRLRFPTRELLETLEPGRRWIEVRGEVEGGALFEGQGPLVVRPGFRRGRSAGGGAP